MATAVVAAVAAPAAASAATSMATSAACCCATSCASKLCCSSGPTAKCCGLNSANILYFIMWLSSTFAAFLLYQFPPSPDSKIVSLSCPTSDPGCQKTPYILRMTFASSLFFCFMALCTIGASVTSSFGHKLHDGFWIIKWVFFIVLHVASVWMPTDALRNYSYIETFGAAVFLLVQIVLLIDFCYDVAEWFKEHAMTRNHAGEESVKPCWALLMICVMIGCVAVIILMVVLSFRWFTTPVATTHSSLNGECGFNSFVIGFAIVLFVAGLGLQIMATSRTGNGSVVTALWVGAYCMWNVFSGLLSTHVCQSQTSNNPYVEPVSIILTILSAAYAAFQFPKVTDGMTKSSKGGKEVSVYAKNENQDGDVPRPPSASEPETTPVPYSYPKFHIAFCFASCFVAMQLSSWLEYERQKTAMDTTTPQAWVKIVSAWVCGLLYIWTILAPVLLPNRDFKKHKFIQAAPNTSVASSGTSMQYV